MSDDSRGEEGASLTILLLVLLVVLVAAGGAVFLWMSPGPARPPQSVVKPAVKVEATADTAAEDQ